ncbi:MAG: OmpA family protein [Desulfobacterales bacterium]|jgi:OOP family OmpA-OmpF porin|nr:OmpA family protein [Desulfobacterales bacterium]
MRLRKALLAVALAGALAGCAARQAVPRDGYQPVPAELSVSSRKIDTFIVVVDTVSSMERGYRNRLETERGVEIVSALNQTIPQLDYRAGLVAFSSGSCLGCEDAERVYGPAPYHRADFEDALARYSASGSDYRPGARIGGPQASQLIRQGNPGRAALIIVTDSENAMHGRAVKTVQKLKWSLGDNLCIYPVLVGRDCDGRVMTEQIVKVAGCGFAVHADDIAAPQAMAHYVREVFLTSAAAPAAAATVPGATDSDGDGVPDSRDRCPGTPAGASVGADGCWELLGIHFGSGEAVVRDTSDLDRAVAVFKANPQLTADVHGHTDDTASAEHNQVLSENRARAVRDYFVRQGIAPERIRAVGFGETRPVASNDTPEGRGRNRRVELHPYTP